MSQAFKYTFDVHGRGLFPVEMLTMEGCYPTTVVDGRAILDSIMKLPEHVPLLEDKTPELQFKINLTILTTDHYWQPKIAHWNKFGWTVGTIRTEYNERSY